MADTAQVYEGPILRTKLSRPAVPGDVVPRDRLIQIMDRGRDTPLTLVSAPAGYGKSVLASQWLETVDAPHAWLSLDESESDWEFFLQYFLAAVRTAFPDACPRTESLVGLPEPPSIALACDYLTNEIDAIGTPFYLVLDDYHRLQPDSKVHELLSRMLEHPPTPLHLVILSRQDPNFPFASLRGRAQLTDVRLRDLRFEREETSELLTGQGEARVSEAALDHLQHEIEGWAVGLRLTALALRHVEDISHFLLQMRGGMQYVQEYLLQEVIAQQAPGTREWLLKCSVLDRFCPELCDAVCTDEMLNATDLEGRQFLDELQRGDLFVIPLDTEGKWFRFHHQFQELLSGQLKRVMDPAEIALLHRRASEWFESRGSVLEAIQHALAAKDPAGAADIIERHRHAELDADRWFAITSWMDRLPVETRQQRPGLLLAQTWVACLRYQMELMPPLIEQAERLIDEQSAEPSLLAELNVFRGILSYYEGKGEDSQRYCEKALEYSPQMRGVIGGEGRFYLAMARHLTGKGELAIAALEEDVRETDAREDVFLTRVVGAQAFVHLLAGDLALTMNAAWRLGVIAERSRNNYVQSWRHYLEALAQLHSHRLDNALQSFQYTAERRDVSTRRAAVDAMAGVALTYQLMGRSKSAANAGEELTAYARELGDSQYNAVAGSCRARLALLQGDISAAVDWARSADAESFDPTMFWLEEAPITRARVQIAEGSENSMHAALELLGTLQSQVDSLYNNYHRVDILVLLSLALDKLGRNDEALVTMEEAVALGGPRGWVRPFIEPGSPAVQLLNRLRERDSCAEHIAQILSAAGEAEAGEAARARTRSENQPLAEPLTNREQQILELLADRLTDKEIAQKLFISPQTVNFHTKRVYRKLGVSSRRQAVAAATEMGVIARHR